jgi:hypothetical protein
MKLARPLSLSMAITCLAFITPLLVGARSLNAQAADNAAASSTVDPAAAQQEASQMVPADAHLVETLDAKKSQAGTQFDAVVDGTVHLKDGTELPHGTVLVGTVATDQMQPRGTSTLALRFTEAKLKDGKAFPIHAMIAEITGPMEDLGDIDSSDDLLAWSGQTYQVDEIGAVHDADLHSSITDADSGALVSTKKDDVKLVAGSRLSLAIAAQNDEVQNSASGGN